MKALKFLKHMKQTDTPYNFRDCELDEAIAELEEAQLTRREWYQKGYAEAMKPKTCKLCAYCEPFNSVCFNDKSPLCADFVNSEYGCIYWKRKDNA